MYRAEASVYQSLNACKHLQALRVPLTRVNTSVRRNASGWASVDTWVSTALGIVSCKACAGGTGSSCGGGSCLGGARSTSSTGSADDGVEC